MCPLDFSGLLCWFPSHRPPSLAFVCCPNGVSVVLEGSVIVLVLIFVVSGHDNTLVSQLGLGHSIVKINYVYGHCPLPDLAHPHV